MEKIRILAKKEAKMQRKLDHITHSFNKYVESSSILFFNSLSPDHVLEEIFPDLIKSISLSLDLIALSTSSQYNSFHFTFFV